MIKIGDIDRTVAVEIDPATDALSLRFRWQDETGRNVEMACRLDGFSADTQTRAWLEECDRGFTDGTWDKAADTPAARYLSAITGRAKFGLRHYAARVADIATWLVGSRETTNFSYDLTDRSLDYLAHFVAQAAGCEAAAAAAHIREALADEELHQHVREWTRTGALRWCADDEPRFGRRLGWYAVVRARKPALVVETGVDKGLGAVLLCAALRRNAAEGHPGRYLGTDIDPKAGYLMGGPYAVFGQVAYGDSLATLAALDQPVGVFINDSDHHEEYEAQEYQAVAPKLEAGAIVLSDNAHATPALMRFAAETGRRFLFFRETPKDHWYPGAGIGFAF